MVNLLAAQNNLVYIDDLKDGPLISWLERFGLSKQDPARIQPGYEPSYWPVLGIITITIIAAAFALGAIWIIRRKKNPKAEKE